MPAALGTLSGQQVELRRFTAADITPEYLGWLSDPEVVRFSNQRFRTHTPESCAAYLASFAGTPNLFMSVVRRSGSRPVGTMTAYVSARHGTADLGILIGDRSCWGHGLGLDAWQTLMNHLFASAGLRKITGGTLRSNIGMVRIMERSGMRLEGVRERQEIVDDVSVDALLYARFRSE